MKKVKRAYHYLFYKFYKMSEAAPSRWWSEWKASFTVDVLIYFVIISLFLYYKIFFNPRIHLSESNVDTFIIALPVVVINYFIFHHRDQWKGIVVEFDELPKRINQIGSWVVFGVVALVIANLIFAFYLMSQVDWSQYR